LRHYLIVFCSLLSSFAYAQQSVFELPQTSVEHHSDWQLRTKLQSFMANDAIALSDINGDWAKYAVKGAENIFMLRNRAELSLSKQDWQIGWEYRQQSFLKTNQDTINFYHLYQQKIRPQQEENFNLAGQYNSWAAQGIFLAKSFSLQRLSSKNSTDFYGIPMFTIKAQLYQNPKIRDTQLQGKINYQNNSTYNVLAHYHETDSQLSFPFMQNSTTAGRGLSLSSSLKLAFNENWNAYLAVSDFWSKMNWTMLPSKDQKIDSVVQQFDSNGYINYRPLLSGQNAQNSYQRRIGAASNASLSYQNLEWEIAASLDYWQKTMIPAIAVYYKMPNQYLGISYEHRFNSLAISYEISGLQVQLRTNKLRPKEASALGINASWHYLF
jgi:hypothetical protein